MGSVTDQKEKEFSDAYDLWKSTGDKKAYEIMWFRVIEVCRAIALKIAPGKRMVEERSFDAAIKVMEHILIGHKGRGKNSFIPPLKPKKLSSYCYLIVLGSVQGTKAQREDQELSWETYENFENITPREEIRGIYREELA